MKKIYLSVIATLVAVSGILVSCTADDEFEANQPAYSYSASEVQEILELQEEYGVDFSFKQTSDRPLPSVENMEELCKLIVQMQSAAKRGQKEGNKILFSPRKTRANLDWDIEKYSGSYDGSELNTRCGDIYYTIAWKDVYTTRDGGVSGTFECFVDGTSSYWDVSLDNFNYHFEGTTTLVFDITIKARYYDGFGSSSSSGSGIGDNDRDFVIFHIEGECSI